MKQSSKTITTLVTGLIMAFGLTLSSCKKSRKRINWIIGSIGATGATGAPEAKTYNVELSYTAGEAYRIFSGVTNFDADDTLLFYVSVLGGSYYIPISATIGNGIMAHSFQTVQDKLILTPSLRELFQAHGRLKVFKNTK